MARQLGYVAGNFGGHDVLLVEIPRSHSRILVRCAQCGRERWVRLHEFRKRGGFPCRSCTAANRSLGRPVMDPELDWRSPVRTPPGILVSSDGQASRNGYLLKQHPDRYGRLCIRPAVNGKLVRFWVHILVCEAFHGAKPFPGALATHENDICTDNRADNLSWKTWAGNVDDAVRNEVHRGHAVSAEQRRKISASLTGRKPSAETLAKRSVSLKKAWKRRKAGDLDDR